jgi:hypothetical protein
MDIKNKKILISGHSREIENQRFKGSIRIENAFLASQLIF